MRKVNKFGGNDNKEGVMESRSNMAISLGKIKPTSKLLRKTRRSSSIASESGIDNTISNEFYVTTCVKKSNTYPTISTISTI